MEQGLLNICSALKTIARNPDTQIIYPVHLNPKVEKPCMNYFRELTIYLC